MVGHRRDKKKKKVRDESYWAREGGGRSTNNDPEKLTTSSGNETEATNKNSNIANEGPSEEDAVQASGVSNRSSAVRVEHDKDGNPTLYSCSAAVGSSEICQITVEFDYQMYFQSVRPADLQETIARMEGGMITYIAEASGLPTSANGNCSSSGSDNASGRLIRRSLNKRQSTVDIIAVSAGDSDKENEEFAYCVDTGEDVTIVGGVDSVDCVPISGTVDVEMIGKDEISAENFVKSSARNWMENYGDYETQHGLLIGLAFLGTRIEDPEIGKGYVEPVFPSEIRAGPQPLVQDDGLTYLGYALAISLCAALAISLFIAARKATKRCSDSDPNESLPDDPYPVY